MLRTDLLLRLLVLTAPGLAHAQVCGTFFVDSNTSAGNLARAINDVNTGGCASGGLNTIVIDSSIGGFGDTVIATPLPALQRPTEIRLSSTGSGVRHVIRSNNATQTGVNFALRASARVVLNDLDIVGGGGRAFFGGVLLESGAGNSRVRGVRVANVRHQGLFVAGADGVEVRRSDHNATEIYSSGFGLNADSPAWQPAILINQAVNTTVYGTFLGQRPDGSGAGNCSYGIEALDSTGVFIGLDLASGNLRNHIGGNGYGGIRIRDSSLVQVSGNHIGVASNGQTMLGNGGGACFGGSPPNLPQAGIVIENSTVVGIGGLEGQGNVVVANLRGLQIDGGGTITVRRNLIGQRPTGQSGSNGLEAIVVSNGAGSSGAIEIGGGLEQANIIRGGPGSNWGVRLVNGIGRVDIRRNSLFGHSAGIARDFAPMPPSLSVADAGSGMVSGSLTPVPDAGEIDFYADDGGQGRWYLGTLAVAADAASYSTTLVSPEFVAGRNLTAIFTRLSGPGSGSSRYAAPLPIADTDVIFRDDFEGS